MSGDPDAPGANRSILERAARGAGWVVAWRVATRVLGIVNTLVLVRLLSPADFGLVALAMAFATALDICLMIGVEDQIVRTRNPTPALYHTAFTLNLLRALAVGALVALLAEPAARFFGDPRLGPVLLCLAALTAAAGLTSIGVADFRREMAFEREFQLMIVPRIASIAVTMTLAFLIPGHWALLAGIGTANLGKAAMSYAMHPYRPRLSLAAWRELAGVSVWSWAISVAIVARDRTDTVMVGRAYGPAEVGIYAASLEIATLPTTELVDPICRACMPGFAASDRAGTDTGEAYLRIIGLTALLSLPAGLGISLVAGPAVALGYGQAWTQAAPLVAVLGAAGIFTLLANVSHAILGARAVLWWLFYVFAAGALLRLVLLAAFIPWLGLVGAAVAVAVATVGEGVALVTVSLRRLGLGLGNLLGRLWRPLAAVAVMCAVLWGAGLGWLAPPEAAGPAARLLAAGVAAGAATYTATLAALWVACGRPSDAAEADMLALLRRGARAVRDRVRRRVAAAGARRVHGG